MKRSTKRYPNGNVTLDAEAFAETQETIDREIRNFAPAQAAVERLAELEDAEEKGLLMRFPCKVGDTVYRISAGMILPVSVWRIGYEGIEWYVLVSGALHIPFSDFGKTVFLTPEAAQQALKERNKDA